MYHVAIIGAGIAGMESAMQLLNMGYRVVMVEREEQTGGHVADWDRLFPFQRSAIQLTRLIGQKLDSVKILTGQTVIKIKESDHNFALTLSGGEEINAKTILVTTGFKLFDAHRKEEYGYGIYDNVITSADLERMFASGNPITTKTGNEPKRVAFIHCVGSRDEKVNNRHCSKVCCATAVKQACEIKQMYPQSEVYCFYMDLRMFDRHFETMYLDAQTQYGVIFVRGRLSEAAENIEGQIVLRAEDTLMGKLLKITVDMMVLMSGMEASEQTQQLADIMNISTGKDGFLNSNDECLQSNATHQKGIFIAGTCTGPKTIPETLADARAATVSIAKYLRDSSGKKN